MNNIKKTARTAGLLYFLVILAGVLNELVVRNFIFVSGDIMATVNNISDYEFIYRLGFVNSLVRQVLLLSLVLVLYQILKPVNKNLAMVMVAFALVQVSIGMVSLLFQFAVPLLMSNYGYSMLFTTEQVNGQIQFFINLQAQGDLVAQLLSVWLFLAGYLVFKSGFFPKFLGILLSISSFGYLLDFLIVILFPDYAGIQIAGIAFLFEVIFPIWLLIIGVNAEGWKKRALAAS